MEEKTRRRNRLFGAATLFERMLIVLIAAPCGAWPRDVNRVYSLGERLWKQRLRTAPQRIVDTVVADGGGGPDDRAGAWTARKRSRFATEMFGGGRLRGRTDATKSARRSGADGTTETSTPTTTVDPERMVFGGERECAEANGGRPCVCRMADLMERVAESAADGRAAAECPSYRVAPAAFVIDSPLAATAAVPDAVAATAAAAPWKSAGRTDAAGVTEVDFDAVIAYHRPTRDWGGDGKRPVIVRRVFFFSLFFFLAFHNGH